MKNRRQWLGAPAAGLVLISAVALAGPGDEGRALYKAKLCDTCHGAGGSWPVSPDYPRIAGQNERYLLRQMLDIRDGRRTNGQSETMQAAVAGVSDEELALIAEWLAGLY